VQRRGRGLGGGRPRLGGAAEQPALAEVGARLAQHGELLGALDALGDHTGAHLTGERHGGAQDGLAGGVEVDAGDHAAAELEEIRPDLGDVLERGETGARIVDGDQRAAGDPRLQALLDALDVLDGVLLGELDDEPLRKLLGEPGEPGVAECVGADVDEQQPAVGRRAGLGDGRPARDLEVVAQARGAGGGERDVRRERDEARGRWEAGQALVADRLEVAQPDDRLEDRADGARRQQPTEIVGAIRGHARSSRVQLAHLSGHRHRAEPA
jgi:hypothetical protein